MICLDSSFLIDYLKGKKEALEKLEDIKNKKAFTTSITEYELMKGAYLGNYSNERVRKIVSLLNSLPIFFFDSNAALTASQIYADLVEKGKEIDETDCMIAGVALSSQCKEIVTKNTKHFERINGLTAIPY